MSPRATYALDNPVAGDPNCYHRAGFHEVHQGLIKRLTFVFGVVLGEQIPVRFDHSDINKLISLCLNPGENLTGQITGNTIWFYHHECFFKTRHV